jgi:hypothetical protein
LCDAATKAAKGTADELWSIPNLRKIIASRCLSLHERWITWASKIEAAGGKPDFQKLLRFLYEQVAEWGSLFAENKTKVEEKKSESDHRVRNDKPIPKSSLGSEVKPKDPVGGPNTQRQWGPCDCCKTGNHRYADCTVFMSKTPQERLSFIRQSNRCRNCFSPRRMPIREKVYAIYTVWLAKVNITLFYMTLVKTKGHQPRRQQTCVLVQVIKIRKGLPIVAVKVTNPINGKTENTYAMLDGGSEFSIIDQSLAKRLGVKTNKEEMTVTTLEFTTKREQ